MTTRLALVNLLVISLMGTLLGRLWFVQIADGKAYARTASDNHVRHVLVPAPRGRILDRDGRSLARNRNTLVVSADYHAVTGFEDGGHAVLSRLSSLLRKPYENLAERLRLCGPGVSAPCWGGSPYQPIPLAEHVDTRTALQITERPEDFPGVSAEMVPVREYPFGERGAQMIGYAQPGAGGRDGLEAEYDDELKGSPGRRELVVNSVGEIMRVVGNEEPQAGHDILTSLDARIQGIAEKALRGAIRKARSREGAAVVMEAKTGQVVAVASHPSYDSNVWSKGITSREYKSLNSGRNPLFSRPIQGQWAPGSTWKVTSVAAALKTGRPAMRRYGCPGSYQVGGRTFTNFRSMSLGSMNLEDAITRSCDTVFYRFAYEMWLKDGGLKAKKKKAKDPMQKMARGFGFGKKTGIDLPGEQPGRVPDRKWKATRSDSTWWAGDAANFAIGQGDVLVTPLQLARAYAAIASGGTLHSPRIGKKIVDSSGEVVRQIEPSKKGRIPLSKKQLRHIRNGLKRVPVRGTAAGAFQGFPHKKVAVAGKTGTAEVTGKKDTAWFVSYTPRYVAVVTLPETGTGGQFAAPAVRKIWEGIYATP